MTLMSEHDSYVDVQIESTRAQLEQIKRRRQAARRSHEGGLVPTFRHYLNLQLSLTKKATKKPSASQSYLVAIHTSERNGSKTSSPDVLRSEVELCYALHKTEVLVKQLHLVRQNITSLSNSMLKDAYDVEVVGKQTAEELNQRIKDTARNMEKLADTYRIERKHYQYLKTLSQEDDQESACTESTMEDDESIGTLNELILCRSPYDESNSSLSSLSSKQASSSSLRNLVTRIRPSDGRRLPSVPVLQSFGNVPRVPKLSAFPSMAKPSFGRRPQVSLPKFGRLVQNHANQMRSVFASN